MLTTDDPATIYQRPAELLARLIRFDTTNPPGQEAACISYARDLLAAAGIDSTVLARDPARPNLIARLRGRGSAPPLLLYGHVDVVTTARQEWRYPPFAGEIADGYVWGRGALDMKGGVAMMLAALLRARAEDASLPGDVVLALVSDEEAGGEVGAGFLTREHAGLFAGVRYALGEFGGFTSHLGGRRLYPIMVAEKQSCALRATVRGPGGHGSLPLRGGAAARLARFLHTLDRHRLPVHVTPAARQMLTAVAEALPAAQGAIFRQLLRPALTDRLLDLLGPRAADFDPLLHNTVNATIIRGGEKNNVIPSEITVDLDGRLLPGYAPEDLLRELRRLAGPDVAFEVVHADVYPVAAPDMGLFDTLAAILREGDPEGLPVPLLLAAVTDGRFFSRLGIQTYGFTPMRLPPGFAFTSLIHAADERVPVEAVAFGTEATYQALLRFGAAR
jgi:acetylornithine deacetylase/succinyl-diaminopimelate desuccinylase-like protein